MPSPEVALIVTFFDEYQVWPLLCAGLATQVRKPDELFVFIDDSESPPPPLPPGARLCRTGPEHDGKYALGAAINVGAAAAESEFIIHIDGDCVPGPALVYFYWTVFSGAISEWAVVPSQGRLVAVRCGGAPLEGWPVLVGPNTYVPEDIPWRRLLLNRDWGRRRPYGQRGQRDGTASMHGCNFAAERSLILAHPFRAEGRQEDADWAVALAAQGRRFLPAPDDAVVAHVGPDGKGRGLGEEDEGDFQWRQYHVWSD